PLNRQLLKLLLAQPSAESQQVRFAAFTAPAKASAITAASRIAAILLINFSFYNKGVFVRAHGFAIGA
ncbi:MAG: hypothetical protein DMG34_21050, partial [Acidobacteria bacterium]